MESMIHQASPYERAFERAKQRTAAGVPTIVTNDKGEPHLRRVPLFSSWPRGKGGCLVGVAKKAVVVNRKLSDEKARAIRAAYGRGDRITQERLADAYGVSLTLINGVVNRRRWVPAT
jgi:hypothetical protein